MGKALLLLAMLSLDGSGSAAAHQRGIELFHNKDYAGAIAALTEAAKTEAAGSADFRESALLIGQSYFNLNQSANAIPWLEKVGPVNEANYMLGYAYMINHQPEQSEAAFAHLFEVKPDSAAGHLVAGQMLLKREYEAEAKKEMAAAIALDPKIPEAHFILGELEIAANQLDQAIDDLKKELAVNPNFSMAWYRLGDAYSRQQKWEAAMVNLQRSIWLNQYFSAPFILLGKCYLKQQNYSNAESILKRGLQMDTQNYSGTYLLVQTLTAEGKKEEAAPLLEKLKTMPHER